MQVLYLQAMPWLPPKGKMLVGENFPNPFVFKHGMPMLLRVSAKHFLHLSCASANSPVLLPGICIQNAPDVLLNDQQLAHFLPVGFVLPVYGRFLYLQAVVLRLYVLHFRDSL